MNNFFTYIFFSVSLCLFFTLDISSQVVSNILVSQEQNNIVVSYDLLVSTSCSISLQVSQDGGASWSSSLKSVKGDVGEKIVSGSHTITWFVLEEYNELRGDNIKFKVSASSGFTVIKIGTQAWTTKNLDVATYRNGDVIPEVQDQSAWASLTTGAWCYYGNDASNGTKYGKLYNWYAVNDPRGLAPKGFHIPSDAEWTVLTYYLGGAAAAGTKMKSSTGWDSNGNGTNSSGFAGSPAGFRYYNGTFSSIDSYGNWWSATENGSYDAWVRFLSYDNGSVSSYNYNKQSAFSVRCLGGEEEEGPPVEQVVEEIFTFAEVMPGFSGKDGFQAYLKKNVRYPFAEKDQGKQGTVYISFVVEKDGTIANVKAAKEVAGAPGFTKEAIRLVSLMPKWTPGMMNGHPVRIEITQPVRFTLQ